MDCHLPGMEGDAAIRMLRSDERTRHIPAVLLTGESFNLPEENVRRLGFNGYLEKPINTRTSLPRPSPATVPAPTPIPPPAIPPSPGRRRCTAEVQP